MRCAETDLHAHLLGWADVLGVAIARRRQPEPCSGEKEERELK